MRQTTKIIPHSQRIVHARIIAGMSKLDIANAAGLTHSAINRAERGMGVSPKTAVGICKALGAEFEDLFTIQLPGENNTIS